LYSRRGALAEQKSVRPHHFRRGWLAGDVWTFVAMRAGTSPNVRSIQEIATLTEAEHSTKGA